MAYQGKVVENKYVGQKLRFIRTSTDTNGELLEIETTYPTKSIEPMAHYHPFQEEWFEVTEGEISIRLDGRIFTLSGGDKIHIPKNKVHSMWNNSANKTVANWIVKPALRTEDFFENAYGLAQDGKVNNKGMPGFFQIILFLTEFSKEFRLSKPPYFLQQLVFTMLSPISRIMGYKATYDKYSK
ncbi:MAG: cupin domain-containing protein [Saprospiraceae bacterium]|nr:cupin domain-containing protein [Saprospiraceae bacterium]MBK9042776.1 cupin domain-containing protein [Saprospiraceae bacterium]